MMVLFVKRNIDVIFRDNIILTLVFFMGYLNVVRGTKYRRGRDELEVFLYKEGLLVL